MTEQKHRPILFSTEMVKQILSSKKSQTRRIVKNQALSWLNRDGFTPEFVALSENGLSPYGQPGDILWVREAFMHFPIANKRINPDAPFIYKATVGTPGMYRFKPSIHMPKKACRIFLLVKSVRIERLIDISKSDSVAEGVLYDEELKKFNCYLCETVGHVGGKVLCEDGFYSTAKDSFSSLWRSINGQDSWLQNPWVWVIEFERVEKPLNFLN